MKILAIETSCDDTGIAILEIPNPKAQNPNFVVLSNIVSSQIKVHKKYGGVYPAMAKREHQCNLVPVLMRALKQAKLLKSNIKNQKSKLQIKNKKVNEILERESELLKKLIPFLKKYEKPDIDLIAVTQGPGLEPCLWVGINFAKALSHFWNIPVVPVNHIESHILVNFLTPSHLNVCATAQLLRRKTFPAIALVVSGGHTQLILMKGIGKYKILGETRDDAAGECFDKCAKILGLGYPGGPAIAKLASQWKSEIRNPKSEIQLPRPMINTKDYDFSFSGLKTAVLYTFQNSDFFATWQKSHKTKIAFAAEIQQAIIDVLIKKTIKAAKDFRAKTIILGGGVSANQELRKQFAKAIRSITSERINLLFPPANLSTDNALMTAVTAYFHRKETRQTDGVFKHLKAQANLRISK